MAPVSTATEWSLALGNLAVLPHQQTKTCTKCGDTKLMRYFSLHSNGRPRHTCRSCMSANANAFNKRNRARAKERSTHVKP